jgi:mannose-6-phosphate isomerase-like protein (cupin superfamily)
MIHKDLINQTLQNENFRQVVATNIHSQLVLMSLLPNEEIGEEVHDLDQILYIAQGAGQAVLDGQTFAIGAGDVVNVPEGAKHNIINGSSEAMKLITVYSPPEHPDGTVHATKAEADAAEH